MSQIGHRWALPLVVVAVYLGGCRDASPAVDRDNRVDPQAAPPVAKAATPDHSSDQRAEGSHGTVPRQQTPINTGDSRLATAEKLSESRYPVRWAEWLELKSIGELEQRFQADYGEGFGDLELGSETIHPTTCAQWAELHARGAEPPTTLAVQGDNTARVRCGALTLLKRASPSGKSYVSDLPRNPQLLTLLPASVASGLRPEREQARAQASRAGKSLKELVPKASIKHAARGKNGVEIREGRGEAVTLVFPEVWGDFNRDGIEDLVVSATSVDSETGDSEARLMILTRATGTESLREVE